MKKNRTIPSTEAQNNFGQLLNDVVQNENRYFITRHNKVMGIILSLGDFNNLLNNNSDQKKMISILREIAPEYSIGKEINES